jgi:succinate dehydrogenase / fumarate reductase cytochrome b subunit
MQTLGWNGKTWFCRWRAIGIIYVTILIAMFILVILSFAFNLAPSLCSCCAG